jgi:hypothetical protein
MDAEHEISHKIPLSNPMAYIPKIMFFTKDRST